MPLANQLTGPVKSTGLSHPTPPQSKWPTVLLGLSAMAIAVGGLGIWGATAPLASAVVASGKLAVESKRKSVQHADGGTIRAIHVRDGDRTKAGKVLIEFEGRQLRTAHAITRIAYFDSVLTAARLRAMLDDADHLHVPEFFSSQARHDQELAAMIRRQRTLLVALKRERDGQVRVLNQRIAQLNDEVEGLEAERAAAVKQQEMATRELATLEKLSGQGYATRDRVLRVRRETVQLEGMIGRFTSRIARAKKEISSTELEILQLAARHKRETIAELRDVERRGLDQKERYLDSQSRLEDLKVRAPVSGTVVESRVHTVGGVTRPGETLMEIVPLEDLVLVEARLKPLDIDSVVVGQMTDVRLTGLNQRTAPTLQGRVVYLSADSLTDPKTQSQYFAVRVAFVRESLKELGDTELMPGMPADIFIKTGTRTAMAYLMQPFFDSMNRAWREN